MHERRKALKQAYKETKTEAGVYQIRNTVNGKVLVASTPNLKTINGQRFQLEVGSHRNARLQAEWKQYGEAAFVFEVLEVLSDDITGTYARQEALAQLERTWLDTLQPYGERGYNTERQAP